MDYKLTIIQKPAYLHAIVNGPNTKDTVLRYVKDILKECKTRKCFRVLVEEQLEGPLFEAIDVFDIVSRASVQALGIMQAVAFVDAKADDSLLRFAENVAVNRTLPAAFFTSVADAEKWLLNF